MSEYFNKENIGEISRVKANKGDNYVAITFKNKESDRDNSLFTGYAPFCEWLKNSIESGKKKPIFHGYIEDYLESAEELNDQESIDEIVDAYGNIMPSDDKPSNANNSGIGSSKFDTDKVLKQAIPRNLRFYSGGYGSGFISW